MAESKGALIAKSMQKHAGRAKEKILQNLGKVDRTADEIFDEHLQNFTRQHQQATRLQKEFNNYIRCIRAVQTASKSLLEAITEVYESSWSGHDLLYVQTQNMEMLWQDFSHKLGDQILIPLNTYSNQFPEMRKKIDKRGRKLVDYDSQRHSFQGLQANAAKRRDDVKVTKGREQLEEAKRTYEILNSELHDELPALHDSRILFLISNLQTLFAAEQLFHSETSKVYSELEAITDKLANESQRGSYNVKKSILQGGNNALSNNFHASPPASPTAHNGNTTPATTPTDTIQPASPSACATDALPSPFAADDDSKGEEGEDDEERENVPDPLHNGSKETGAAELPHTNDNTHHANMTVSATTTAPAPTIAPTISPTATPTPTPTPTPTSTPTPTPTPTPCKDDPYNNTDANPKRVEELYDIPVGATLSNLPPGVLYRVRATYRYTREDQDELSFEVGDIIRVVEYEDPEEQEEGWLMGLKEGSTEKGMFPANFTRPI